MDLLIKIFYDLNCQDIPAFLRDNINTLFEIVLKYLVYSNPLLESDTDEESGPIEKVKTSICEL